MQEEPFYFLGLTPGTAQAVTDVAKHLAFVPRTSAAMRVGLHILVKKFFWRVHELSRLQHLPSNPQQC
jgi:hypothetical protein